MWQGKIAVILILINDKDEKPRKDILEKSGIVKQV